MGLIGNTLGVVFGSGGSAVRQTVELFRENAEAGAERDAVRTAAALAQFGSEFNADHRGFFDRFMDGLNRLPRPGLALGTLALFVTAMVDPIWFGSRMAGLSLVPEPLWWLLGAIVTFYFGARQQAIGHEFQRSIATSIALAPQVAETVNQLHRAKDEAPAAARPVPADPVLGEPLGSGIASDALDEPVPAEAKEQVRPATNPPASSGNAALDDWRADQARNAAHR